MIDDNAKEIVESQIPLEDKKPIVFKEIAPKQGSLLVNDEKKDIEAEVGEESHYTAGEGEESETGDRSHPQPFSPPLIKNDDGEETEKQGSLPEDVVATNEKEVETLPEQPSIHVSLLAVAQLEHAESSLDDDEAAFVAEHSLREGDEDEELEEEDETLRGPQPFSPPLIHSESAIDDNDMAGLEDLHELDVDGRGGSSGSEIEARGEQVPAEMPQGGSGSSLLSLGGFGRGFFDVVAKCRRSPEAIREKAAANYQHQMQKLDEMMVRAKDHGKDIQSSHVGLTQKGYLEQGVAPPAEAMKSAFDLDKSAQMSWGSIQENMADMESIVSRMQKNAIKAGFDSDSTLADITERIDTFTESMSSQLEGMTDSKGNLFSDRFRESQKRMIEMLKKLLESLKSLFRSSPSMEQST